MRFMILITADKDTEAGVMPSEKLMADMTRFNEDLVKAGVMLAGEGLKPTSAGARVRFDGDSRKIVKGPFPLSDRPVCGWWLWKCASMDEAIEWVKRCPNPTGTQAEIEIRPVFESEDFGAEFTPELREKEERMRREIAAQA